MTDECMESVNVSLDDDTDFSSQETAIETTCKISRNLHASH